MEKRSRHGSYGILIQDGKVLLTQNHSGPYQGLWGLPGGGIEFGESPEDTLQREFLEETGLSITNIHPLRVITTCGSSGSDEGSYHFHHICHVYRILVWEKRPEHIAEEQMQWVALDSISYDQLIPFTKRVLEELPQSRTWNPEAIIRPKAVALIHREGSLLVCEVLGADKQRKGWTPLGGKIEFGETADKAVQREIKEELGCSIEILSAPLIIENIFHHHGHVGHEIVYAFIAKALSTEIYAKESFQICEHGGTLHQVKWVPLNDFKSGKETLLPSSLLSHL